MNLSQLETKPLPRFKKLFRSVLSGSSKLSCPDDATLFLQSLYAQDDPLACLNAITQSVHGLSSVRSAMQLDASIQFVNGTGSTVLQYLLNASSAEDHALNSLLLHIMEPPSFWNVFLAAFEEGALAEPAQLVFAQVLYRLLTLQSQDATLYRDILARPSLPNSLITSPKQEIRDIGYQIKEILATTHSTAVHTAPSAPGGRHDNDFADYRRVSIIPTADEISCQKPPFLRTTTDVKSKESETPVRDHLDNIFRMLREDVIFNIRKDVQTSLREEGRRHTFWCNVSMVGLYTGLEEEKARWGIKLRCEGHDSQLDFLPRDPRDPKVLQNQSLVCLVSGQDIISFGTVNCTKELLVCNPPVVVLQLDGDVNIKRTIVSLCKSRKVQLFQIPTDVSSFEPVLAALKRATIPFSREVVLLNADSPIEHSRNKMALSHITDLLESDASVDIGKLLGLPEGICLDTAQTRSFVTGIQQRISLIQDPPGTEKSFISAILAKAIHDKTSQTILMICHTNRVLDQFLNDLLKYNVPADSIICLERSNTSVDQLLLHQESIDPDSHDWDEIQLLKARASYYKESLESGFERIQSSKSLMAFLEHEYPEFYDALRVPPEAEVNMFRFVSGELPLDDDYLFLRWKRGLGPGLLSEEFQAEEYSWIWNMAHPAREQLLDGWLEEIASAAIESIWDHGKKYDAVQAAIERELARPTVEMLRQKRIIACTTTTAAVYAEVLEEVGPEVLLVEEAGEILESHILAALSYDVNQMILVGDHKQLRPEINKYELGVEKGEYDLNRSLFERLVLKGYPYVALTSQHRMRPEISRLLRELSYPGLADDPSTTQRPNVRGVQSNVIFVDHSHLEDNSPKIYDRAGGSSECSKQNKHEVEMVIRIVRYLLQQGYKGEDLVVLTPYLGQLVQLRDALKDEHEPALAEQDASELERAGLLFTSSEPKSRKNRIKLSTIDSFRREESDIVIASLTRANESNAIGFLDSPERLNVLLSRARTGLILLGNSWTFWHSGSGGPLWKGFLGLLEEDQHIYQGFPIKCERHPERTVLITRASDFDLYSPDGGCPEPCAFTLACGHPCPMKCHLEQSSGLFDAHSASLCKHMVNTVCPAGEHSMVWECRLGRPSLCLLCVKEAKRLEEVTRGAREQQRRAVEEAEKEYRRKAAELNARLQAESSEVSKWKRLWEDCNVRIQQEKQKQEELSESLKKQQQRQERDNELLRQMRETERRRMESEKSGCTVQ